MTLNMTNKVELVNGELVRFAQYSVRDAAQSLLDANGGGRIIDLTSSLAVAELAATRETFTVWRYSNSD